jgi:membrane protein implicated in regulation of membrane protease activity
MPGWIWILVALGAFAVEMSRGDLYVLWFGIGALVAALFGTSPLSVPVFVVLGVGLLLSLRPPALRLLMPSPRRDPPELLVGKSGVVVRDVSGGDDFDGQVIVDGRRWTVRSYAGVPIASGTTVEVLGVEGVRLLVHPQDNPLSG